MTSNPGTSSGTNGGERSRLHPADLELARRVQRGDAAALDRFVRRMQCVPRFLAARNRQCGVPFDREALADLVQDVLGEIWRKLPQFRGDAVLETLAYRFCEFGFRSALRRLGVRRVLSVVDPADLGARSHEPRAEGVDLELVHRAVEQLPADEAAIVRCKHFDSQTFDVIAERLRISPNTAKTRYYRALATLRRALQNLRGGIDE